jgi:enterochelin esterase-like enzyme
MLALLLLGATLAQQSHVNLDAAPHRNTEQLIPFSANTVSPEVDAQGRITLRLQAPNAQTVTLAPGPLRNALAGHGANFTKDASGLWTLTTNPLPPNIYVYHLLIDGARVPDPNNTIAGNGNQPPFSEVIVPDPAGPAYYDARNVPHGAVTRHIYHSNVTQGERELYVYTPPGYDGKRRYPVLYLLGGSGELASGWMHYGRANLILDNLLAEGKALPMIIAMPNNQVIHRSHPQHVERTFALFESELRQHIVPFIDQHYRTQRNPRGRALAGLSMGARHTQRIGFQALDLFSSLGILSGGDPDSVTSNPAFFQDKSTAAKINYLLIAHGDFEEQPLGLSASGPATAVAVRSRALRDTLKQHNIPHEYYVGGGGAHDWRTWRHILHARLLPKLFR